MLDRLTVLELTGATVAVLAVLHAISRIVDRARAKARPSNSGTMRAVEPTPVASPEPRNATLLAADASLSAGGAVPPASNVLLPPVEVIPPTSDTPLQTVEAIPPESKIVPAQSPRFAKPQVAARRKSAVLVKTTPSSKLKRRPKRWGAAFEPVAKVKPTLTRRPKRVTPIRRKKISVPVRRTDKPGAVRSPRRTLVTAR
jgi:hypothetical protein